MAINGVHENNGFVSYSQRPIQEEKPFYLSQDDTRAYIHIGDKWHSVQYYDAEKGALQGEDLLKMIENVQNATKDYFAALSVDKLVGENIRNNDFEQICITKDKGTVTTKVNDSLHEYTIDHTESTAHGFSCLGKSEVDTSAGEIAKQLFEKDAKNETITAPPPAKEKNEWLKKMKIKAGLRAYQIAGKLKSRFRSNTNSAKGEETQTKSIASTESEKQTLKQKLTSWASQWRRWYRVQPFGSANEDLEPPPQSPQIPYTRTRKAWAETERLVLGPAIAEELIPHESVLGLDHKGKEEQHHKERVQSKLVAARRIPESLLPGQATTDEDEIISQGSEFDDATYSPKLKPRIHEEETFHTPRSDSNWSQ